MSDAIIQGNYMTCYVMDDIRDAVEKYKKTKNVEHLQVNETEIIELQGKVIPPFETTPYAVISVNGKQFLYMGTK